MTDNYSKEFIDENKNSSDAQFEIGSYRENSFLHMYSNQHSLRTEMKDFENQKHDLIDNFDEIDEGNFDEDLNEKFKPDEEHENSLSNLNEDKISDLDEENLSSLNENNENLGDNFDNLVGIPINKTNRRKSHRVILEEDSNMKHQFARSLPITIPNRSFMNNRRNIEENDLDWLSVKNKPEDIAKSIKALARSVRDGTEMFGELPSRKFNASEIVQARPL